MHAELDCDDTWLFFIYYLKELYSLVTHTIAAYRGLNSVQAAKNME